MLEVRQLSKSFGGVTAVDDVSFSVRAGAVHSVIGPNGAGKTTLFNLVSGVDMPSAGEVLLDGKNTCGLGPDGLARLGMSRTFQNVQLCMNMSACENVMLGAHLRTQSTLLAGLLGRTRRADKALRDEAAQLMQQVGVGRYADAHTTQLPFGALKRLEIARALAGRPRLLLLDEPAAGLNETETHEITETHPQHRCFGCHGRAGGARHEDGHEHLGPHPGAQLRQETGRGQRRAGAQQPAGDSRLPGQRMMSAPAALEVEGLVAGYGRIEALRGIDICLQPGQLVALVGANGAGKTTLLRTLSGLIRARAGQVRLFGADITAASAERRVRAGLAQVLEGRQVFGPLSVLDNLRLGAYTKPAQATQRLEAMYELFPVLKDKRLLPAGTLSGGQQQMLAMARALISIADHGYVLEAGRVVLSGSAQQLLHDERVQEAYLGLSK